MTNSTPARNKIKHKLTNNVLAIRNLIATLKEDQRKRAP